MTAVAAAPSPALTPTLRRRFASWRFWIVLAAALLAIAVLWSFATSSARDTTPFGAGNAGPDGGRAVAEVLRQRGVDVVEAGTLGEVRAAVAERSATTVLVNDTEGLLSDDAVEGLDALAGRIVLLEPSTALLERYAPGVALGGATESEVALDPGCPLPEAGRAGSILSGDRGLQAAGAADAVFCYTGEDGLSQIARQGADPEVTVLASASPFVNERVAQSGDAALVLAVLGAAPTLVWYEPGLEVLTGGAPTAAELTPEWASPVLLLLVATFIAAAVWRGRRMGPLVVENLPVVVRAGETIEGRARLYRRHSTRLHALDALRVGTVRRIASVLRLPRSARVEDVCGAVCAATGRREDEVRGLLVDDVPHGDRDLVDAAARLAELERQVHDATGLSPDTTGRATGE